MSKDKKVISLVPSESKKDSNEPEHGRNVEESIADILEIMESKSISNVAIVMVSDTDEVISVFSNFDKAFSLIGGLSALSSRISNGIDSYTLESFDE